MGKSVIPSEKIMSDKVDIGITSGTMKMYGGNKLKCDIAIREMGFKQGVYDVIGYNREENTVYIFECKLLVKLTSIGGAFGQLLAYKAELEQHGYEFLNKFFNKYISDVARNKMPLKIKFPDDWNRILNQKQMNFKFFVVVMDDAKRLYQEILSIKNSTTFKIGVLTVTKGGICTPHLVWKKEIDEQLTCADPVVVLLDKKYTKEEFFDELEERLRTKLPKEYTNFKTNSSSLSYKQFKILIPNTHFEVGQSWKKLGIAFHIESGKEKTERLFNLLKKNEKDIKQKLGKNISITKMGGGWKTGKGGFWASCGEFIPKTEYNEGLIEMIVERLKRYFEVLQPIIEQKRR